MITTSQQALLQESDLLPGDGLVFSRTGFFDDLIKEKTFSHATHVEVYVGNGKTVASRNGKGVAIYDLDLSGIYRVLRPQLPFDLNKAMVDFEKNHRGKPYGWKALLNFANINLEDNGEFCSEFKTFFWRAGGFDPFNETIEPVIVAPADFLYIHSSIAKTVWKK